MQNQHPWTRYVAIGDSFTEGIGDVEPRAPGGNRGWADRLAEELSRQTEAQFSYANLAIRGRLLQQILDEQIEPALALKPDLVTISAGGNDIIRPGTDPDQISSLMEPGLAQLSRSGATVVLFTGIDVGFSVFKPLRGKVAIYNENLRALAAKYDCVVADMWSLTAIQQPGMWTADRLHLNPYGHHAVAKMVLQALNVDNDLDSAEPEPLPPQSWRQARQGDLVWARSHLVPWVLRRLRHESSGDGVTPKRPEPGSIELLLDSPE